MKAIVIANWKTHPKSFAEAKKLFVATKKAADLSKSVSLIVAPPALFLRELARGYRGRVSFCAQAGLPETVGAHTGEMSLAQFKDARCTYALVGHAERRAKGETDADVSAQLQQALALGMTAVLCVGERARSADGQHFAFVKEQLRSALAGVKPASIKRTLIAYEPVWAIGAGTPMSSHEMHEMSIFIRKTAVESLGTPAMDLRILYGGSIDEHTARPMVEDAQIQGLLVGHVSTDAAAFSALIRSFA